MSCYEKNPHSAYACREYGCESCGKFDVTVSELGLYSPACTCPLASSAGFVYTLRRNPSCPQHGQCKGCWWDDKTGDDYSRRVYSKECPLATHNKQARR